MPLARQLRILYVGCLDGLLAERKPEPSPVTRGVEDHARRVQTASLPFTRVEARPVGTGRVRHHCSKQGLQPPPHTAQQARRVYREIAVRTHPAGPKGSLRLKLKSLWRVMATAPTGIWYSSTVTGQYGLLILTPKRYQIN